MIHPSRIPSLMVVVAVLLLVVTPAALAGDKQKNEDSKSAWWTWSEPQKTAQELWAESLADMFAAAEPPSEEPAPDDPLGAKQPGDHSLSQRDLHGSGVKPTSIPILDPDFLPPLSWAAHHLDPATWSRIRGPEAHAFAQGRGVVVAVLDCGFNTRHPTLRGHIHPFSYDALDEDDDPVDLGNGIDEDGDGLVDDGIGHGTFVSGMVLLAAPRAQILAIRVANDEGELDEEAVLRGLQWARWVGARVVNLSLKVSKEGSEAVSVELEALEATGALVIVAAGNDGQRPLPYVRGSLMVGAVNAADVEAPFSSVTRGEAGSENFVYAPGVDLHGPFGSPRNRSVAWWSGTSFATGIVSGAAALLYETRPELSVRQRVRWITSAVAPAYRENGLEHARAGRIDLLEVIR